MERRKQKAHGEGFGLGMGTQKAPESLGSLKFRNNMFNILLGEVGMGKEDAIKPLMDIGNRKGMQLASQKVFGGDNGGIGTSKGKKKTQQVMAANEDFGMGKGKEKMRNFEADKGGIGTSKGKKKTQQLLKVADKGIGMGEQRKTQKVPEDAAKGMEQKTQKLLEAAHKDVGMGKGKQKMRKKKTQMPLEVADKGIGMGEHQDATKGIEQKKTDRLLEVPEKCFSLREQQKMRKLLVVAAKGIEVLEANEEFAMGKGKQKTKKVLEDAANGTKQRTQKLLEAARKDVGMGKGKQKMRKKKTQKLLEVADEGIGMGEQRDAAKGIEQKTQKLLEVSDKGMGMGDMGEQQKTPKFVLFKDKTAKTEVVLEHAFHSGLVWLPQYDYDSDGAQDTLLAADPLDSPPEADLALPFEVQGADETDLAISIWSRIRDAKENSTCEKSSDDTDSDWTDSDDESRNLHLEIEFRVYDHFYRLSLSRTLKMYEELMVNSDKAVPDDVKRNIEEIRVYVRDSVCPPFKPPPFPRNLLEFSFWPPGSCFCPYIYLVPLRDPNTGRLLPLAPAGKPYVKHDWLGDEDRDDNFVKLFDEVHSLVEQIPAKTFLTKNGRLEIMEGMAKCGKEYLGKLSCDDILMVLHIVRCYFWSAKLVDERPKAASRLAIVMYY